MEEGKEKSTFTVSLKKVNEANLGDILSGLRNREFPCQTLQVCKF